MRLLREALLDLRGSWSRWLLPSIGLLLAVLAVVAIVVTGNVARQVLVATAEQRFGRATTVAGQLSLPHPDIMTLETELTFVHDRAKMFGTDAELTVQAGVAQSTVGGHTMAAHYVFGDMDEVRRMPVLAGRGLLDGNAAYPPIAVVNQAAAALLGGVGAAAYVRPVSDAPALRVQIVGVVVDGDPSPQLYAPLEMGFAARPAMMDDNTPQLLLHNPDLSTAELASEFNDIATALSVDPTNTDVVEVDQVASVAAEVNSLQTQFLFVALVAMVVATGGLASVGLATVAERSRELTLRRALGATRLHLVTLLLVTNGATGLAAAVFALGLAETTLVLVAPHVLNHGLELVSPGLPWQAAAIGIGLSIGASLIAGAVPAMKAARFDAATLLRG